MNVGEIRKKKEQYNTYYGELRTEQGTDQDYYDDIFKSHIKAPYHEVRTGTAAKIVDTVVQHINTSNPQASRAPRKNTQKEKERAAKVSRFLNYWLELLIDETEEVVKNCCLMGEAFWQIEYNSKWEKGDEGLPVMITAPDPTVVFPSPIEINGVPRDVIKTYEAMVSDIIQTYPNWSNPNKKDETNKIEFMAYYSGEERYFEAGGEALFKQVVQKNALRITPFVHCYSGLGKRTADGSPEKHAMGLLRKRRGRLVEECDIESRLDSIVGLFANPVIILKPLSAGAESPPEDSIDLSPGSVVILPPDWEFEIRQGDAPKPELYSHLAQIRGALGVELPPVSMGMASGSRTSGRLEDILGEHYQTKYNKMVSNIERSLSTALGIGLKLLEESDILPITVRMSIVEGDSSVNKEEVITKQDIDGYYDCKVELKAPDILANDRKAMLYRTLRNERHIDWETLLTEGLGYTQEKAGDIITQTIADTFFLEDPTMRGIVVREALETLGMQKYLKEIEEDQDKQQEIKAGLDQAPQGGSTRPSEARNPSASGITRQMLDQTPVGVRNSPEGM